MRLYSYIGSYLLLACVLKAQDSITPKDRLSEAWWAAKHTAVLEQIKCEPGVRLVMLGDSITQNYEKNKLPDEDFNPTWQKFYAGRNALNLGYSGDRTENLLWRLDHGEVDGIHPQALVLLIGTNNTGAGQSASETERGIDAVVTKLREKLPTTGILLLGILPNSVSPAKMAADQEINRYLASRYAVDLHVTYLDIGPIFYKDRKLNETIFYDPRLPHPGKALHPDTVGQRMMAEAIEPTLTHLMGDGARQYLRTLADINSAVLPVPRLEMDSYDWYRRHQEVLAAQKTSDPRVVLIGDSITHFWAGAPKAHITNGPSSWELAFHGLSVLNLGFGWDRTQNVLWRLSHGEFEGLHPKTVVINIGTNNMTGTENARSNTPEEIVQGILAIHTAVRSASPASRIIVMGIFPRGVCRTSALRETISRTNELLSHALENVQNTTFLDIGSQFLQPAGALKAGITLDGTHPTDAGYALWAQALIDAGVRN